MSQITSPVFCFHSHQIRTTSIDKQPWFVAKDVCAALNITWSGATFRAIPSEWRSMLKLNMEGFPVRTVSIISEPAVYKLAFRSNKPEADAFTNWVASEVLPAIRKTGKYEAKSKQKALPEATQKALPPSHAEVDTLLGKIRFYIGEIADAEKRITDIVDERTLPALKPFPGRDSPAWAYIINAGCSTQALFSSINFALKAVDESIKLRLQISST